jgi:hypothetical protein
VEVGWTLEVVEVALEVVLEVVFSDEVEDVLEALVAAWLDVSEVALAPAAALEVPSALAAISWAALPMKPISSQVACAAIKTERVTSSSWTNLEVYMVKGWCVLRRQGVGDDMTKMRPGDDSVSSMGEEYFAPPS